MKRLLLVFTGLMAGVAHAQTVNWDAAFSSCSSEAAAFDRHAVENSMYWQNSGSLATWRHLRRDYTSSTIDVPSMRRDLQSNRSLLSRGPNPIVALSVCVEQAALNQVQSGPTQSASPASTSGRNMPEKYASHCINYVPSDPGAVRNTCNERVNLRWCSLNNNSNNRCGNNNLGWAEMAPGATTYVDGNVKSYVFGCFAPAHPSEVEYTPGRGLQAYCKQ